MTRVRIRIILIVAACLAAVGLCVLVWAIPEPGVTKYNYDRIQTGMSLAEVEAIFGKPADEKVEADKSVEKDNPVLETNYVWRGWKCSVFISIGTNGVSAKVWQND